ncbi:gfo/Idh/MocA family oxidoreductase [Caulobacter flavus]|uniref:Gfo/Idh/MocA family oxidoreductase n=1 Tax=Caulobacter flavus TaxID=1679497 RepID=A0A2N5CSE7_9CAUL|nr:Gfo/Idh/MocA family oxidoreductase [Caulobacter flavus]AYV49033.1 gfo/Idh/MocA family oxidoreductase [Caulobacter flavus]PLR13379.1 gfo/Idh/MocA family oxidoreductase [Caulobacter flavus]
MTQEAQVQVLKAGIVGAGVFGGYHAKKYVELPGVELVAVFDIDLSRAEALAGPLGAKAYDDMDAFLAAVDVVTVATPAVHHAKAALAALKAGKPVYSEKPLAVSPEDADALIAAAAKAGVPLACGHQERVVFQAMGLLDIPEQPIRLEAVRRGTPSDRNLDVSVVLDLMIHDIDLALALCAADPVAVEGEGEADRGYGLDWVKVEATFANGFTAVFDSSRVAEARERTMKVVFPSGEVEIDFLARTFRNTTQFPLIEDFTETPAGKDPLGQSVAGFLKAVRGEAPRPVVTGEEAARALDLALAVEHSTD